MRRFLAFALLASAAVPALAAQDYGNRHGRHQDSGQQSSQNEDDRSGDRHGNRGNRGSGNEQQPQQNVQPQQDVQPQQHQPVSHVESTGDGGSGNQGERRHFNGLPSRFSSGGREQPSIQPGGTETGGQQPDSVRDWRSGERGRNRGPRVVTPEQVESTPTLRQPDRQPPSVFRHRVPVISDTPREGTQPRLRDDRRRTGTVNWNTSHWRNDHRYDWQNWRRHHRSIFHLSFYYDPFGWNYRPYQVGWRLWPSYYSSRYWINDPYEYRLPYAPPGYRWIRYYDDALLVDTWNGQVVDVIYNFFW